MIIKALIAAIVSIGLSISTKISPSESTLLYFAVFNTLMLQDLLEISKKKSEKKK